MESQNCHFCNDVTYVEQSFIKLPEPAFQAQVCCSCGARGPSVENHFPEGKESDTLEEMVARNEAAKTNRNDAVLAWNIFNRF